MSAPPPPDAADPSPASRPEAWLRGPVAGVPTLLQPVAHALAQAVEDVRAALSGFPDAVLWTRPADVASVGFHLRHLAGVLDRMATYARAEPLTEAQFAHLADEGIPDDAARTADLVAAFEAAVRRFTAHLAATDVSTLAEPRTVGRQRLPSTVIGLLVHAAEHTTRHTGQLIVTARVVRAAGATAVAAPACSVRASGASGRAAEG